MVTKAAEKQKKKRKRLRRVIRRTIEMIGAVTRDAVTRKQRRGFPPEERAAQWLNYWRKKKLIVAFRQTKPFDWEDMTKKDFFVTLLGNKEVPFQVKNHCNLEVVRECFEADVFFYFLGNDESDKVGKNRMRDLIISMYISVFRLEPYDIHQLVLKILAMKNIPQLPQKFSLKRIFSRLGGVAS